MCAGLLGKGHSRCSSLGFRGSWRCRDPSARAASWASGTRYDDVTARPRTSSSWRDALQGTAGKGQSKSPVEGQGGKNSGGPQKAHKEGKNPRGGHQVVCVMVCRARGPWEGRGGLLGGKPTSLKWRRAPPSPPGTALPLRSPRSASNSETLHQIFSLSSWDIREAANSTDSLFVTLADIYRHVRGSRPHEHVRYAASGTGR